MYRDKWDFYNMLFKSFWWITFIIFLIIGSVTVYMYRKEIRGKIPRV